MKTAIRAVKILIKQIALGKMRKINLSHDIGKISILIFFCMNLMLCISCSNSIREENKKINPEIYPAFRRIENYALLYIQKEQINTKEYERCKMIVDQLLADAEMESKYENYYLSAEKYCDFLESLGFELPPFRLNRIPTKEEKDKAMYEQEQLLTIQNKLILESVEREINNFLKKEDD